MNINMKILVISMVTMMIVGAVPMTICADAGDSRASRANSLSFTSSPGGLPATGEYPSIAVGKFNNDAYLDIASGMLAWYYGGGTNKGLYVWTNNNGGTSWTKQTTGLDINGEWGQVAVADINKDGFDDIVAPHETYWSGQLTTGIDYYTSDGAANPSFTLRTPPTNNGGWNSVQLADVNKDGDLDIIAASDEKSKIGIQVYLGDGGTTWTNASTGLPGTGRYFSVAIGDLDKDGDMDIVAGSGGTGVEVYKGDGGTSWTKATGTGLPTTGTWWSMNISDLDNDGNNDIIAGSYDAGGLSAYTGNGAVSFTKESSGLPTSTIYCQLAVADIDKNGFKDIWGSTCDPSPKGFGLFLNDGAGTGALVWTQYTDNVIAKAGDYSGAAAFDIDNDGDLDLMGGGAGWTPPGLGFKVYKTDILFPTPIADAGLDQTVLVLDNVTLDGSASKMSVGSGTIAGFDWNFTTKPTGSTAVLDDETIAKPKFMADKIGTYTLSLSVKDAGNKWSPVEDTVTITANAWVNKKPLANAGTDKTVTIFSQVQLDGSKSWDDAQVTAYDWNITQKPTDSTIVLSDETIVNPTFTPDYVGVYKFTLTVKDVNNTWSKNDEVVITVNPQGSAPPTANAGADVTIELTKTCVLDASASTDDQSITSYEWTIATQPLGSAMTLQNVKKQNMTPTHVGLYEISLKVKDNDNLWSQPDTMSVMVTPRNLPPVAKIDKPEDKAVFLSTDSIEFDGKKSADPEGSDITFKWTSDKDGEIGTLDSFSKSLSVGAHKISLEVADDRAQTTIAIINITVNEDTIPTADLSASPTKILKGEKVNFDATGSKDTEGVVAEYMFDFGDSTTPVWAATPKTSHVYKNTGTYKATVKAKDNKGLISNPSTEVVISVGDKPTAAIKVDLPFVKVKKPVVISAADSKDSDGTVMSYYFEFGDGTNSGWINSSSQTRSYTKAGEYIVTVKVRDNDGYESANTATVKVTVSKPKVENNAFGGSGAMLPIILVVVIVAVIIAVIVAMKMKKGKQTAAPAQAQVDLMNPPPPSTYAGQDQTAQQPAAPAYQGYDQTQYQQQQAYDPNAYQQPQQGYDPAGGYQYPPQQGQ